MKSISGLEKNQGSNTKKYIKLKISFESDNINKD